VRSITRATILFFVAAGALGAMSVVLFLLGPKLAAFLGVDASGTVTLALAAVLAAGAALLVYRGVMRAAAEQDEAAERRERDRRDWRGRQTPRPPAPRP
jgi:hypothetical protein